MFEAQIVGNTFTHLTGGNKGYSVHGKESKNICWVTDPRDVKFFVDNNIAQGLQDGGQANYGWLLESKYITPGLSEHIVDNLAEYKKAYKHIFTHDRSLLNKDSDLFKWVPAQGFWIKDPKVYDKSKLVSMIASNKNITLGHGIRLAWVNELRDKVDLYGRGFSEIESKEQGLCDYMFSVAIENGQYETYFTEKVLDCFATGTMPIYIGAPDIGNYFNSEGIVDISNFDEISEDLYYNSMDAIRDNLERVKKMEVLEDFIYENYLHDII